MGIYHTSAITKIRLQIIGAGDLKIIYKEEFIMGNLIDGFFETKVGAFIGGAVLGGVFGAVVCHGSTKTEYLPAPAPALEEGKKKKKKKDKDKKDA